MLNKGHYPNWFPGEGKISKLYKEEKSCNLAESD